VLINHASGEFPWFQPPVASTAAGPGWLLGTADGEVSFFGPDDPRQPLNVRLIARLLDCTGASSAPIDVVITDPGRPDASSDAAPEPAANEPASNTTEPKPDAGMGELARSSPRACSLALAERDAGDGLVPLLIVVGLTLARRSGRRTS
jgi:hypothetical protein